MHRVCAMSDLPCGTYFSFEKDGKIYVSGDQYIKPGKKDYELKFVFHGMKSNRVVKYQLQNSFKRIVYLHDQNPLYCSAHPSKIKTHLVD